MKVYLFNNIPGNSKVVNYSTFNFIHTTFFAEIAQLGERQTEDLKVLGSNP